MSPSKSRNSGRLTPRRLQILTFIRDFQRSRGYSPTMQELANELGVTKVTVFEHVEALVEKGMLRRSAYKARSLELTSAAQFPDERDTLLHIAGRIAAGHPIEAIENVESLDLETMFAGRSERFVLEVQGESMINEQIRDGDFVIVEKRSTARDRDIVVAVLSDGDATLKKYYRDGKRIRLEPANPKFKPIFVKEGEIEIQGVVIGVVRRY